MHTWICCVFCRFFFFWNICEPCFVDLSKTNVGPCGPADRGRFCFESELLFLDVWTSHQFSKANVNRFNPPPRNTRHESSYKNLVWGTKTRGQQDSRTPEHPSTTPPWKSRILTTSYHLQMFRISVFGCHVWAESRNSKFRFFCFKNKRVKISSLLRTSLPHVATSAGTCLPRSAHTIHECRLLYRKQALISQRSLLHGNNMRIEREDAIYCP